VAYAALSNDIENDGGIFMANSRKCKPNPRVFDPILQRKLFDASLQLLGISTSEFNIPIPVSSEKEADPNEKRTVTDAFVVNLD